MSANLVDVEIKNISTPSMENNAGCGDVHITYNVGDDTFVLVTSNLTSMQCGICGCKNAIYAGFFNVYCRRCDRTFANALYILREKCMRIVQKHLDETHLDEMRAVQMCLDWIQINQMCLDETQLPPQGAHKQSHGVRCKLGGCSVM